MTPRTRLRLPRRDTRAALRVSLETGTLRLLATELLSKLSFGSIEHATLATAEVVARAVDVEREHGHRRAVRLALAAVASLSRALERARDALRVLPREHTPIEVERVALGRHFRRPSLLRRCLSRARCGLSSVRHGLPPMCYSKFASTLVPWREGAPVLR